MTADSSNRGFGAMDEEERARIEREGGESQGREDNPGNFANDRERARRAGEDGDRAQPTGARREDERERRRREDDERGEED